MTRVRGRQGSARLPSSIEALTTAPPEPQAAPGRRAKKREALTAPGAGAFIPKDRRGRGRSCPGFDGSAALHRSQYPKPPGPTKQPSVDPSIRDSSAIAPRSAPLRPREDKALIVNRTNLPSVKQLTVWFFCPGMIGPCHMSSSINGG